MERRTGSPASIGWSPAAAFVAPAWASVTTDERRPRILVLDSDEDSRRVAGFALSTDGFEVVATDDPAIALELVAAGDVALVVSDLGPHWPAASSVVRTLTRDACSPPVLAFSAALGPLIGVVAARSGCAGCLLKPCSVTELRAAVRRAIAGEL